MAGDFHPVKLDPAIERWNHMREHVYKNFHFTRRNTRFLMFWGLAVPAGVFYAGWYFNGKFDWRGARRGESLLKNPPKAAAPPPEEE